MSVRPRQDDRRRGVTLVELVAAMALLVTLAGALVGFSSDLQRSRAAVAKAADGLRASSAIIDAIEEAALASVAQAADGRSGVAGDAASLRIVHHRVAPAAATRSAAPTHERTLELSFNEAAGSVEIALTPTSPSGIDAPDPAETSSDDAGPIALPVMFEHIALRYHDGNRWTDEFDALDAGALPRAIAIGFWFGEPTPPPDDGPAAGFLQLQRANAEAGLAEQRDRRPPDRWRVIALPGEGDADDEDGASPSAFGGAP